MGLNGIEPATPPEVRETQAYKDGMADATRALGKPGNVVDSKVKEEERSADCHHTEKPDAYSCGARDALASHNNRGEGFLVALATDRVRERINLPFTCRLKAGYQFAENAEACVDRLEAQTGIDFEVREVGEIPWLIRPIGGPPYVVSMPPRLVPGLLGLTIYAGLADRKKVQKFRYDLPPCKGMNQIFCR